MEPIITLKNVSVIYGLGKSNENVALKEVSLEIFPGEYIVFFGPSGCGKSTLLYTIAGLEFPTKGEVVVGGKDLRSLTPEGRMKFYQDTIGMVFQAFYLVPHLTAKDNLTLPQVFRGVSIKERENKARELMNRFGITEFSHRKPSMMSGGQQQRTAIARSLVNDPEIILADEPVGNLDSKNSQVVLDLLAEINNKEKKTVIQVTHNPKDIYYADRIFYMKDGKVERVVVNKDKIVSSAEGIKEKGGGIIEDLALAYPHLSETRLLAKSILNHLLIPYDFYTVEKIEKVIERYIKGEIDFQSLVSLLDNPEENKGIGLYSQKALSLAGEIKSIVAEMKVLEEKRLPSLSHEEARAAELKRYLLDGFKGNLTVDQIDRLDHFLRLRIMKEMDTIAFAKILDLSEKRGGIGLDRRTARRFAKEIEILLAKDK